MRAAGIHQRKTRGIPLATICGIAFVISSVPGFAGETVPAPAPAEAILYTDSMGRTVRASTNDVPRKLQPAGDIGVSHQIPELTKGTRLTEETRQRIEDSRQGKPGFEFFPASQPKLPSYLASQDELGNTAIRPGALVPVFPAEPLVQGAKYRLSEYGLRYSLKQTLTYVSLSDVLKGDSAFGFYTLDFAAKWAVFDASDAGTAGWITTQIEAQSGLGTKAQTQDAKSNLGSLTDPTGIWSSREGWRVPELAWQQSLADGQWVVVAGMVNQGNYFDANTYAQSGRGQFINSALINTMVMPLAHYNFGGNLQFQPGDDWYALAGGAAGNGYAGQPPGTDFNWQNWSVIGELGYTPANFLGWGPGIYRVQPFIAGAPDAVQGGLCFNLQQQLGERSPFGWFGRFGFGGEAVAGGAAAQIGSGFVLQAPLMHAGLVPKLSNDLLGAGFVWSQPADTSKTVYHENEYGFETFYTLQLTPTLRLQPDLQVVWDRAFNPESGPATVFQLQLLLGW